MEVILSVLPICVALVFMWLTYLNISYGVILIRAKKKDHTLESCLHKIGTIFYLILIVVYVVTFIVSIILLIILFVHNDDNLIYYILNMITVFSIVVSYLLQHIIFVGSRQMLIGNIILDYRKIKRVTYPKETKLRFVYGQKKYQTSLWFINQSKLKRVLRKTK
jgi:Protein of unknown function (DUF2463).